MHEIDTIFECFGWLNVDRLDNTALVFYILRDDVEAIRRLACTGAKRLAEWFAEAEHLDRWQKKVMQILDDDEECVRAEDEHEAELEHIRRQANEPFEEYHLWQVCLGYYRAGEFEAAKDYALRFLHDLEKKGYTPSENATYCYHVAAECSYRLGHWTDAFRFYDKYHSCLVPNPTWAFACVRSWAFLPEVPEFPVLIHFAQGNFSGANQAYDAFFRSVSTGESSHLTLGGLKMAKAIIQELAGSKESAQKWRAEAKKEFEQIRDCRKTARILAALSMWTEMEDVCRGEHRLHMAAELYEGAGRTEDAARIYEGMAEEGKPGGTAATQDVTETDSATGEKEIRKCSCGEILKPHWRICPSCGKNLDMVCSCGEPLKEGWKLCPTCGKEIGE